MKEVDISGFEISTIRVLAFSPMCSMFSFDSLGSVCKVWT